MTWEISGDVLVGASIALVGIAIGQFLQYLFSTKKENKMLYIDSLKKSKNAILKARFNIRDRYISSVKIESYRTIPLSKEEWRDFSRNIVIGLIGISSNLYTFSKTKDIAKSIDDIIQGCYEFYIIIRRKNKAFH